MPANNFDWKERVARSILGEPVALETLEGYHITPRKYRTGDAEQIDRLTKLMVAAKPKTMEAYRKLDLKPGEGQLLSPEEIAKKLDNADTAAIMRETAEADSEFMLPLWRSVMLYGIGEHDFNDDGGKPVPVDEALVEVLLESQDVAGEIVGIIQKHNRPLASATAKKSGTSTDGSE